MDDSSSSKSTFVQAGELASRISLSWQPIGASCFPSEPFTRDICQKRNKDEQKKILFLCGQYLWSVRGRFCSWEPNYSATTVLSQAVQVVSAAAQQESQHSVFAASSVASAFFWLLLQAQDTVASIRATTAKDINTFFIILKNDLIKQLPFGETRWPLKS